MITDTKEKVYIMH